MTPQELATLSPEQRVSPQINNIDPAVANIMANAGYGQISVPPGMTANPNLDHQGQPIGAPPGMLPNHGNQHIEPNFAVSTNTLLQPQQNQPSFTAQPQVQMPPQVQVDPKQSIAGRGSPYAAVNMIAAQQAQQAAAAGQLTPQQQVASALQSQVPGAQPQYQMITDESGNLKMQEVPASTQQNVHPQLAQFQQQQQPAPQLNTQIANGLSPAQMLASNQAQSQQQPAIQQIQPHQLQQPQVSPESQTLKEEIMRLRGESDSLKQMMMVNQIQSQEPQQSNEPPKLADFIKDLGDNFDQAQALNPNSPSGAAYAKWVDAERAWRDQQIESRLTQTIQQNEQKRLTEEKINALAANNKEFQDVYGRADVAKIQQFWDNVIGSDWGKLKQAYDIMNGQQVQQPGFAQPQFNTFAPQGTIPNGMVAQNGNAMQQILTPNPTPNPMPINYQTQAVSGMEVNPNTINSQANMIVPLHSGGVATGVNSAPVQLPQSIQAMQKTFGNHFSLPPGATLT